MSFVATRNIGPLFLLNWPAISQITKSNKSIDNVISLGSILVSISQAALTSAVIDL